MLRFLLGDRSLLAGINHYITKYQFQTVDTNELEDAIEEATGQNLYWFFDQWVYKAGYPVFAVSYPGMIRPERVSCRFDKHRDGQSDRRIPHAGGCGGDRSDGTQRSTVCRFSVVTPCSSCPHRNVHGWSFSTGETGSSRNSGLRSPTMSGVSSLPRPQTRWTGSVQSAKSPRTKTGMASFRR